MRVLYLKEVFTEVPDEITLALSISNCKIKCKGCNQPELWEDVGNELNEDVLEDLINIHKGITCVCIMGSGNKEYDLINKLMKVVKNHNLKTALYLGEDILPNQIDLSLLDFIKIGRWDDDFGGLDNPYTNQMFFKIEHENGLNKLFNWNYKFYESKSKINGNW